MSSEIQMKVKIDRQKLLETLKKNRAQHRDLYEEATEGYKRKLVDALREFADEIEEQDSDRPPDVTKKFGFGSKWARPTQHLAEYDRAIRMLEMGTGDDIVTLTVHDFAKFVDDDWEFKNRWLGHTSNYSAKAAALLNDEEDD
jgi:hypothetical protein